MWVLLAAVRAARCGRCCALDAECTDVTDLPVVLGTIAITRARARGMRTERYGYCLVRSRVILAALDTHVRTQMRCRNIESAFYGPPANSG